MRLARISDIFILSGSMILACHLASITATVLRPKTNLSKGIFVKADFLYDFERDVYSCRAGNQPTYRISCTGKPGVSRLSTLAAQRRQGA